MAKTKVGACYLFGNPSMVYTSQAGGASCEEPRASCEGCARQLTNRAPNPPATPNSRTSDPAIPVGD